MRLSYGDHRSSIAFLSRLQGSSRSWNLMAFQSGWWGQQNLNLATQRGFVSIEDVSHWWRTFITFTCWGNNVMLHNLPIRFLWDTEDCSLLQMQDIPARNNILLHLLFTNGDNLLDYIGSCGYIYHNNVDSVDPFKILQNTFYTRVGQRPWILEEPNSICSEPSHQELLRKQPCRANEFASAVSFSKTAFWMAEEGQEPFIPQKGKRRKQNRRRKQNKGQLWDFGCA